MGRATRIRKRTSRLTITLAEGVLARYRYRRTIPEAMRVGYVHDLEVQLVL